MGLIRNLALAVSMALLALPVVAQPSDAAGRVALVIGNAAYAHAPRLANPVNDAADIGEAFERLGFAVTRLDNVGQESMRRALQAFALAASTSEVAVVFYAGHGIEIDQRNFLIPVDARLRSDRDVEFETVPLELVVRAVEPAAGFRLIVLDACRDNPFAASMQRSGKTRSIGRGLARVEPSGETLLAYAAKGGTLASDGAGRNSPYSEALLAHLEEPGLEVGLMFRKVRDAVLAATGGVQEPFVYGSLSSKGIYLKEPPEEPERIAATDTASVEPGSGGQDLAAARLAAETLFWESVKESEDPDEIQAYLDLYSEGTFASLAKSRLERLTVTPDDEIAAVTQQLTPEQIEASLDLRRADRRLVQHGLASLGHAPGPADGVFGPRTRRAIRAYRLNKGFPEGEFLTEETIGELVELGREEARRIQAEQPMVPDRSPPSQKSAFDGTWLVTDKNVYGYTNTLVCTLSTRGNQIEERCNDGFFRTGTIRGKVADMRGDANSFGGDLKIVDESTLQFEYPFGRVTYKRQ